MEPIRFKLNGNNVSVDRVDPHTTLLAFLRGRGLTGAKEGCAEGECGACAVVFVRQGWDGKSRLEAANSCLILLPQVADQEIYTVEGIAQNGALHEVQQAIIDEGASQCGYCTPGFVMSMLAEHHRPGRKDFRLEAIDGNLCRCTGYRSIVAATEQLSSAKPTGFFEERLAQSSPAPRGLAYGANGLEFVRPTTIAEVLRIVESRPDAKLIAGGTDVVIEVLHRRKRFPLFVSLEAIPELRTIDVGNSFVEIGAAASVREIGERLSDSVPMVAEFVQRFASPLIRGRATLGGNLATASPVGDLAPLLLALSAEAKLVSAHGERIVPLDTFFAGYRKTALTQSEIIASVRIPKPFPSHARFYKIAKRDLDDIATISAAFALTLDGRGQVEAARFAYGGVAAIPMRARAAEDSIVGMAFCEEAVRRAKDAVAGSFQPISDHRGSARYRHAMLSRLIDRFYADIRGGGA